MSHSRFLLPISFAAAVGSAGCGDDVCGPGGAPLDGVTATATGVAMTFGQFTGSPNRDCQDSDTPSDVISVSIEGKQTDGEGRVTLCVARPDLLTRQVVMLGPDVDGSQIHVVDFAGSVNNCTIALDKTRSSTGTASAKGLCGNGSDHAGFALVLDGFVPANRTCGQSTDAVLVMLHGLVAVAGPPTR